MAVPVLTIAGSTKTFKDGSLNLSATANGSATLSFTVTSTDGSYRPALDAEVILTEGAARIFGGLVERPTERGVTGTGSTAGIFTSVSCVDFNRYADRRHIAEQIGGSTLKAALTAIVTNYLANFGVTLHGSQVDGPTIPFLTYDYRKVSDVLNELATLTADGGGQPYVWRIDNFKVLRMYQPTTVAAPFNITDNTPDEVVGDVTVEVTRKDYANRVVVKMPTKQQPGRIESFVGDGSTTTFTTQYDILKTYGIVHVQSGGGETLSEPGGGGQWEVDTTTNTIERVIGPSTPGETYNFTFDGSYAGLGLAEDAGEIAAVGIYEKVVIVDAIEDDETAQTLADSYLARSLPVPTVVKYQTLEAGFEPGQEQTITMSLRNLSGTAVVTDVVTRDLGKDQLIREITLVIGDAQSNLGSGWRDVYKTWAGDRTGGTVAIVPPTQPPVTGTGSLGPAIPFTSVQFNRSGVFGGDAEFTYDPATDSIVCGELSSITAGNPSSCGVFGYDGHIADP